jgi:hypothetical protein
MSRITVNGHNFNDSGVCVQCGADFMDVEGQLCTEHYNEEI